MAPPPSATSTPGSEPRPRSRSMKEASHTLQWLSHAAYTAGAMLAFRQKMFCGSYFALIRARRARLPP